MFSSKACHEVCVWGLWVCNTTWGCWSRCVDVVLSYERWQCVRAVIYTVLSKWREVAEDKVVVTSSADTLIFYIFFVEIEYHHTFLKLRWRCMLKHTSVTVFISPDSLAIHSVSLSDLFYQCFIIPPTLFLLRSVFSWISSHLGFLYAFVDGRKT